MSNIYHEKHLIGGLLSGVVTTRDLNLSFLDFPEMAIVVKAIQTAEDNNQKTDIELVSRLLAESSEFYSKQDLFECVSHNATISTCTASANVLKQDRAKQEITERLQILLADSENLSGGKILNSLTALTEEIKTEFRETSKSFKSLADLESGLTQTYAELYAGVSYAVPTFFDSIDFELLDGFSKGDSHIIVGFTGSGKSSLMLSFAYQQALRDVKVGIISREMSEKENMMRLHTAIANVPRYRIKKNLFEMDFKSLNNSMKFIAGLPISIDTQTATIEDLKVSVKSQYHEFGLEILYIDYLQLLRSDKKHSSRANEIQYISRSLKELAMELDIPIVSLCQFNRGAKNVEVFELVHQLKESSGLEQDASTIMFVDVDNSDYKRHIKPAKVVFLKNRNGTCFKPIAFDFTGETFTFTEANREVRL